MCGRFFGGIKADRTELYALSLISKLNSFDKEKGAKMMNLKKHLDLLGMKVKDRITGFNGVVATVGFDLYGCVQAIVNPGLDEKGDIRESRWFDVNRLIVTDTEPVMDRPNFEWTPQSISEAGKGPAERPAFYKA